MKKTIIIPVFAIIMAFMSFNFPMQTSTGYNPGDKAADFTLKNIDGSMVTLSAMKDIKGAIVVFTCNHCPFAQMYEQRIIALHNKYAPKGYPVVAINPNDTKVQPEDSYENMQKRASQMKYPFVYLLDDTQATAKAYGAQRTPHVYVLSKKDNAFTVEFIGAIDDNAQDAGKAAEKYVEKAIDELSAGKTVTTKTVKAVGCTIKWRS
ncbi:MAG: thioredoxin family protein [Cytophagales bacterium]|nr:thioredoxin family protein [Cytophagales bacterium]